LLQVGHIAVRPVSSECGEVEISPHNVLALPLSGVFAKHDGPRQHTIATADHALLIPARRPYRLSFPGAIGDRCLALRFSSEALHRAMPETLQSDSFDTTAFSPHALLPPVVLQARSQLWRRLCSGHAEPLEVEELGLALLRATLLAASTSPGTRLESGGPSGRPRRRLRHVHRTIEAISVQPERRWTLAELAGLASVSPGHLAHVFRAEMGISVYGYVLRARLTRSLEPVLDASAPLTQIALDAGFAHHSHFTARFRAFFGQTPRALRLGQGRDAARHLRTILTVSKQAAA
jgi:AraC family transcriptional regulator